MIHCHDMKKGQIFMCEDCGLELQVIQECTSCGASPEDCEHEVCQFICCDQELKLKA